MDTWTLHLLGLAVEACRERGEFGCWAEVELGGTEYWFVECKDERGIHQHYSTTLADALAALLADLGETVEWPSAEECDHIWRFSPLHAREVCERCHAEGWEGSL